MACPMDTEQIPLSWSRRFGLAVSPLFELNEVSDPHSHHVFLDGGQGTFALSISNDEIWREDKAVNWAWSSDIAHHVTVNADKVAVVKWDRPGDATVLSRSSVDRNLDEFYRFLNADRVSSTRSVVYHLLSLFRRIRSLVSSAKISDDRTSDIFLFSIARLIFEEEVASSPGAFGLTADVQALYDQLDPHGISAALEDATRNKNSSGMLRLYPELAIRHSGGLLFQEAHFELIRAPAVDFFGYVGAPRVVEIGRGGTHFTPPALARILVEQTLRQIPDLDSRKELRVCDPACGSGVFLHEVLRALRRMSFAGRLILVGRDISPIAISMARFVLSCAARDWQPTKGIELDLKCLDSLGLDALPNSDLIVMNPPFISWGSQTDFQRDQLISIVGKSAAARGDLSMAFVTRSIEALNIGGAIGTLFPASLLSQRAAEGWRKGLLESAEFTLLGMIGDYGLFTHALVQTGCAVLRKAISDRHGELTALVTGNDISATGEAIRALRKAERLPPQLPIVGDHWGVFPLQSDVLKSRQTWKLRAPAVDAALRKLEDTLPKLGELFQVRQGVQTGDNSALLLNEKEWRVLPAREKRFFRRATMTDSINNGRVTRVYYLFYPHTADGPLFGSEKELKSAVPDYYRRFLEPNKRRLANRATIKATNRKDWWGLMRPRSWSFQREPRIISKYFSGEGGFFVDANAEFLPSTGFVWFAKATLKGSDIFSLERILYGYAALLNSSVFGKILQYYAPHVAGGQFDLSPRYVDEVPLPDFGALLQDEDRGRKVARLSALAERRMDEDGSAYGEEINYVLVDLYGPEIIAAL